MYGVYDDLGDGEFFLLNVCQSLDEAWDECLRVADDLECDPNVFIIKRLN